MPDVTSEQSEITTAPEASSCGGASASDLSDIARAALADRVDTCRKAPGAVASLVDEAGYRIIAHGHTSCGGGSPVDEHTVFELGCIAHVFDALLLTDMVERGEVELADPVERYLPSGVRVPGRGPAMTLQHLATHTSGLPGRRIDAVGRQIDIVEGSIDTATDLHRFLSVYTPTRDAGSHHEYSHVGIRLLRHALTMRGGVDYETLLRTRIFDPLGMRSTGIAHTPAVARRMAAGHNDRLEVVPPTGCDLYSTAHDLSIFLRACIGGTRSSLDGALARMLTVRRASGPRVESALGWEIETHGGDDLVCQAGVSPGFRSWIGYRPRVRRGVVMLSNAATIGGLLDVGYHLLDSSYPLLKSDVPWLRPSTSPRAVAVPDDVLEAHVGLYQLTPAVLVMVTREGSQLFAERAGNGRIAIVPESPLDFFCTDVDFYVLPADTRISFKRGDDGSTVGMTFYQRGQGTWLPRLGQEQGGVWFGKTSVPLAAGRLGSYVGRYRMIPTLGGYRLATSTVNVIPDLDRLIAEFDNGLRVELIPKSDTEFFVENDLSDVQFTFELDASGRAASLVGTFDGISWRGVRVDHEAAG